MRYSSSHRPWAGLILAWFLLAGPSSAENIEDIKGTITTEHGRRYQDVEVLQRDPHGITFRHANGIAKIPFSEFPEGVREKYQYDKKEALKFLKKHAATGGGPEKRDWVLKWQLRPAAIQFLPEAYTSFVGNTPITYSGANFVEAWRETEFHSPSWIYPIPVNVPFDMYLWRQLSVQHHLDSVASQVHRTLSGYGDVRRSYHKRVDYPRVAYEAVPAIGLGKPTPGIGAGSRRPD